MNKKGFFGGTMVDIYGWLIFILSIIIWLAAFSWTFGGGSKYVISENEIDFKNDGILLNYLISPVESKDYNLGDLLIMVYEGKENKDLLKKEINLLFEKVYSDKKPVCWNLWYYDGKEKKLLINEKCKGKTKLILDGSTIMPTTDRNSIRIRLTIPGYK